MTGTNCDLFTHKSSRSYLNHLVHHDSSNNLQFPPQAPSTRPFALFFLFVKIVISWSAESVHTECKNRMNSLNISLPFSFTGFQVKSKHRQNISFWEWSPSKALFLSTWYSRDFSSFENITKKKIGEVLPLSLPTLDIFSDFQQNLFKFCMAFACRFTQCKHLLFDYT